MSACLFSIGNPKGVMLTHGNIVADFSGFLKATDKVISPNQEDVLISFLPLAHMFERLIEAYEPKGNVLPPCQAIKQPAAHQGSTCSGYQGGKKATWHKIHESMLKSEHT
ncbi:long-chain-fatty-acid--CoA ligase 6 [Tachysurus ichikawai]